MPPAEAPPVPATWQTVRGFGGGAGAGVWLVRPGDENEVRAAVGRFGPSRAPEAAPGIIARGLGRSYGDAAQLAGGHVLDMTALRRFEVDRAAGTVTAAAGATIGRLLADLLPTGWTLPVVPGTQHVTVGGAIASDVHGKNHPAAGSFVHHLDWIRLLTSAGDVRTLEPERDRDLFLATCGGMGLTGVILAARLRLEALPSTLVAVDTDRVDDLDTALALLAQDDGATERVAWLDLLGPRPGRAIVARSSRIRGRSGPSRLAAHAGVSPSLTVPDRWPAGVLSPNAVRAFNELRWRRAPRCERARPRRLGTQLFPLDALSAWPRLYGRAGLIQYQFAVPAGREDVLEAAIGRLRSASAPCYLAVLKRFGERRGGPLSFPIAGWTMALDMPRAAPRLDATLDSIDRVVAEAGGRVYLTKDARLRPDMLATMYPELGAWQRTRAEIDPDGRWRSDLALRTGLLVDPRRNRSRRPAAVGPRDPATSARGSAATRVLLLGGTSEIGLAIVEGLVERGPLDVTLLGRDPAGLASAGQRLADRGCGNARLGALDARAPGDHRAAIDAAFAGQSYDVVILAVGVLGVERGVDGDVAGALELMEVNFVGCGSLMLHTLAAMRGRGGTFVVLSSVAGERVRAGNAVYGATKAGLDGLAQGLTDAAAAAGVRILIVRPGFVSTRMTAGLKAPPLSTTPEAVARAVVRALDSRANTIWVPGALRAVMSVLRHLPRSVFRRLPA